MKFNVRGVTTAPGLLALVFTLLIFVALGGAATVHAQKDGGLYAAADLTAAGSEPGPTDSSSTAIFEHTGAGATKVTLFVTHLQANTQYTSHIHDGGCSGGILYPLATISTDAEGTGQAVTELATEVAFGRWYIDIHSGGPAPSSALCGAVNPALAKGPTLPPPSPAPGMPATGEPFAMQALLPLLLGSLATLTLVTGLRMRFAPGKRSH